MSRHMAANMSYDVKVQDKSYIIGIPDEYLEQMLPTYEYRKLDNIKRFGDFVQDLNEKAVRPRVQQSGRKPMATFEDWAHSFIDQHERGVEPDEEEE